MQGKSCSNILVAIFVNSLLLVPAWAQLPPPPTKQSLADVYTGKSYSPYAGRGFPNQVYWGNTHEKFFDVAWSGERQVDAKGKLSPVGNTVDVKKANWTNTIGASELATVWQDPVFDPGQKAFYYARVIEIPTPRWSTYDAFRYGVELPEGVPSSTQERAYTSPIWYTP
jgi:hypothetical protein